MENEQDSKLKSIMEELDKEGGSEAFNRSK